MIINKMNLLAMAPIKNMMSIKDRDANGVSYGLCEVGYDIRLKEDVLLDNIKRFKLASSMEEFQMPTNLVGIVHDKSTWARNGLSVFNTVIEPGWNGFLTLELVYHGNGSILLSAGTGIAQVIFHELTERAAYTGPYQNQGDRVYQSIA